MGAPWDDPSGAHAPLRERPHPACCGAAACFLSPPNSSQPPASCRPPPRPQLGAGSAAEPRPAAGSQGPRSQAVPGQHRHAAAGRGLLRAHRCACNAHSPFLCTHRGGQRPRCSKPLSPTRPPPCLQASRRSCCCATPRMRLTLLWSSKRESNKRSCPTRCVCCCCCPLAGGPAIPRGAARMQRRALRWQHGVAPGAGCAGCHCSRLVANALRCLACRRRWPCGSASRAARQTT